MLNHLNDVWQTGKRWYVAFTKPRQEDVARYHLTAKAIEVFYPKLFLPIPNRSGCQTIALFPNYLFVRIDLVSGEYSQVVWCRGIKKIVSFGGIPSPVDHEVVDFLKRQADADGLIMAKSNVKVGDRVHIAKGPFQGLVGIIQHVPDKNSRVRVLMEILNRQVRIDVPVSDIEMDWVAPCVAL